MEPIPISVEIRCSNCGKKSLVAEGEGDNPADDALVTCTSCGAEAGRWADVKQKVLESSKEQIIERLKNQFGSK